MSNDALPRAADNLRLWLIEKALPLAATKMRDPEGGYFEDLTPDGQPRQDQIRRIRVQPRQAYVFAHAATLGWHKDARALSDHGFDYLLAKAAHNDPLSTENFDGFAHRLNPDGTVADAKRDTYDLAFVLLACAWRIKAFDCARSRAVATATLAYLDNCCGQSDGSFLEGHPDTLPRRQNPHMHLFEAFLALGTATGDDRLIARATSIYDLFQEKLFDKKTSTLNEYFTADWSRDPENGHLIEPGHMMEWCWLLDQYEQITGTDTAGYIARLYPTAEKYGLDQDSGFLMDVVSLDPQQPVPVTRRTWVQTEYIKATLTLARRGDKSMATKSAALIDRLMATYLAVNVPGGYVDRYGASGEILSDAMPTSTLYHLMSLVAEADRTAAALS